MQLIRPAIETDIMPASFESAIVYSSFDRGLEALTGVGYDLISLGENALLRIQQGLHSYISQNANWTREGIIYIPKRGKKFLTKKSPILDYPKDATKAHRERKEYLLSEKQIESALADSIEIEEREIPTTRFGEDELTVYAFEDIAQPYGLFLKEEGGIEKMPIWLKDPSKEQEPFARQMWLRSLIDKSVLTGCNRYLMEADRLRGVRHSN